MIPKRYSTLFHWPSNFSFRLQLLHYKYSTPLTHPRIFEKFERKRETEREMEVSSGNRSRMSRTMFVVLVFVSATLCSPHASLSVSAHQCKAWLVHSIPTDMPHLPRVSGVLSTGNNIIYILTCCFVFMSVKKCILILGFVFFFFFLG